MSVQSLVPVAVEQRLLPQLYPAAVIQEIFGNEALYPLADEDETDEHKPELFSFINQGEFQQRTTYCKLVHSRNFDGYYSKDFASC